MPAWVLRLRLVRAVLARARLVHGWASQFADYSRFRPLTLIFVYLSALIWGVAFWAALLMVRPIIRVEVRAIPNRLGHLVIETDLYLANRQSGNGRTRALWFYSGQPSNSFFAERLSRSVTIWPRHLAWGPFIVGEAIGAGRRSGWSKDITPLSSSPVWLEDDFEVNQAQELLEKLGADPSRPFVCLWVRNSSYARNLFPEENPWLQSHRDAKLSNYRLLCSEFEREGFTVLRMGYSSQDPVTNSSRTPVDYAASPLRSDVNDLLLTKYCSFAISGDSGSVSIPLLYRKPLALVNLAGPFGLFGGRHVKLVTLKTLVWKESLEPLSLSEMRKCGVEGFTNRSDFERLGVFHRENTPEDLAGVAADALAFLRGGLLPVPKNLQELSRGFLREVEQFDFVFDAQFAPSRQWLRNNPQFGV